jgi:hypothetical protein
VESRSVGRWSLSCVAILPVGTDECGGDLVVADPGKLDHTDAVVAIKESAKAEGVELRSSRE